MAESYDDWQKRVEVFLENRRPDVKMHQLDRSILHKLYERDTAPIDVVQMDPLPMAGRAHPDFLKFDLPSPQTHAPAWRSSKIAGWILISIGSLVGCVYMFLYDVSVPAGNTLVSNYALMNNRICGMIFALGLVVVGGFLSKVDQR